MHTFKSIIAGLTITFGLVNGTSATPISFNLNAPDSRDGIISNTYAMQYNYAADDLDLALTGWSYGRKTTLVKECKKFGRGGECKEWKTTTTTSLNEEIEQDYVGKWDGLGVEKTDSPNHAVDNEAGDYDMHLLSFDELVKLTTIDLGWYQNDTDISILAFNGTSFDSKSLEDKKWQDLLGNGWQLVGNYYNVDYSPNDGAVNQAGVMSQYWLIGAYNAHFGNTFNGPNINASGGKDYYKLKGVTVERPAVKVSESGILWLLGIGLIGLCLSRRRAA